jgi:hypothetical protein
MKKRKRGLLILASLLISQTLLAVDVVVEVPFELYRGYVIVVRGSVGGQDKLNFLIDTGAVPSVVDQRIVRKLKLSGRAESLSVFSQNVPAQRVVLPDLQIGPVSAQRLPVLVRDLAFVERGLGVRIDALVGLDVLGRSSFSIDYQAKKIVFGAVDRSESGVAFVLMPGYVVVQLDVQGQSLWLVVDTGTKDLVLFEGRVRGRFRSVRNAGTKAASNMGGEAPLLELQLPEARLGTTDLGNQKAFLLATSARAVPNFDGLLGVTALGVTRLAFDFDRRAISWQK